MVKSKRTILKTLNIKMICHLVLLKLNRGGIKYGRRLTQFINEYTI